MTVGERGKFLVFIGDHGRLIMSSQDKNKEFASLFLPGEPLLQVQRHSLEREGRCVGKLQHQIRENIN